VPEPESWTMLILGFGAIGGAMRYRTRQQQVRTA
jgi:PEP-CTERM motif